MSTARVLPLPLPLAPFPGVPDHRPPARPSAPRRRSTPEQGRALEILGHAIEYLVDSHLFDQWETPGDAAAVRTLMSCSRQVFEECEQVSPWHQRVQQSVMKRLHMPAAHAR